MIRALDIRTLSNTGAWLLWSWQRFRLKCVTCKASLTSLRDHKPLIYVFPTPMYMHTHAYIYIYKCRRIAIIRDPLQHFLLCNLSSWSIYLQLIADIFIPSFVNLRKFLFFFCLNFWRKFSANKIMSLLLFIDFICLLFFWYWFVFLLFFTQVNSYANSYS